MATQNNPSAVKAGETDVIAARREAAAKLLPLFGGKTADGKETVGVFHAHGIAAVVGASPDHAKFVDELRSNPHAKSLAIVAAARGNKNFPPTLVAELFSRPEVDEDNDWFARVFLGGLAEIFTATGVGLMLPPTQAGLDMVRGAYNVVAHLSAEEREKLGLCEADEAPRRQLATDLMEILDEEKPAPLTPAQQLYRWAIRKWDARQERRSAATPAAEDAAAALPQAVASKPEPEAPKAPVIPDLVALTGSEPTPPATPVKAPRVKKASAAPAAPAVALPSAPPPVEESKPTPTTAAGSSATSATEEDRRLLLAAISKSADAKNIYAQAFLALKGENASLEEMANFAIRRKLFPQK